MFCTCAGIKQAREMLKGDKEDIEEGSTMTSGVCLIVKVTLNKFVETSDTRIILKILFANSNKNYVEWLTRYTLYHRWKQARN